MRRPSKRPVRGQVSRSLNPYFTASSHGEGRSRAASRPAMLNEMNTYEIHSGRRTVSIQHSVSPLQAAVDYVRSLGTSDDEIRRLGVDSVAWRGARFSAVLAPPAPPPDRAA